MATQMERSEHMHSKKESFTVGVPLILDVLHFLQQKGFNEVPVKTMLNLPEAMLRDPDGRAPLSAFMLTWEKTFHLSRSEGVWLSFATRGDGEQNLMGELAASGSNAADFLRRRAAHYSVVNPAVSVFLRQIDEEMELRIQIPDVWREQFPGSSEQWALAILYELIKEIHLLFPGLQPTLLRSNCSSAKIRSVLAERCAKTVHQDPSGHSVRFQTAALEAAMSKIDATPLLLDSQALKEWEKLPEKPHFGVLRAFLSGQHGAETTQETVLKEAFSILSRAALRSTFLATLELAVLFGFPSHQQFSRLFRSENAANPREWRKAFFKNPSENTN